MWKEVWKLGCTWTAPCEKVDQDSRQSVQCCYDGLRWDGKASPMTMLLRFPALAIPQWSLPLVVLCQFSQRARISAVRLGMPLSLAFTSKNQRVKYTSGSFCGKTQVIHLRQNGNLFCLWRLNRLWLNSPVRRIYHHSRQSTDKKGCLISMSGPNSSHGCPLDKSQIHDAWTFYVKEGWPVVKYLGRLATPSDS